MPVIEVASQSQPSSQATTTTLSKIQFKSNPNRRAGNRQKRRVFVSRWPGFPPTLQMTMAYTDTYALANGAGSVANQVFSCNGLHDPDITGGGHQVLYYDQLSAVYNHYTVTSSYAVYQVLSTSVSNSPSSFTAYIDDDSTPSSPLSARQEMGGAQVQLVSPGMSPKQLKIRYSSKANFGGDPLSDSAQQGAAGNPTEQMFYIFTLGAADGSSVTSVSVLVRIFYTVVWQELKSITGS